MRPRFLADENLNKNIVAGIRRQEPALDIESAQSAGLATLPDPDVLAAAARDGRILLSHDEATMPACFFQFIVHSSSPGLFMVPQDLDVGEAIDQIILVWAASDANEWANWVNYLPF